MTKHEITIRYLDGLILTAGKEDNETGALSLTAQIMQLGFAPNQELFNTVKSLTIDEIKDLYDALIPVLRNIKGADVIYKPMYPNFPQQVMEASKTKLFLNAMGHYWTGGLWKPDYKVLPREFKYEFTKFITLSLTTEEDYLKIFDKLLGSNDSISELDKQTLGWFIDNEENLKIPREIPFKENMCYAAGKLIEQGKNIPDNLVKTATDVLRIATYLSEGDISLGTNTKFKSFPRATRTSLINMLERVISEEDIERHRNKWVKLFHELHVGDYRANKVHKIADKIRDNQPIRTYNGKVEMALDSMNNAKSYDLSKLVKLLQKRPGEYARRLDQVVRSAYDKDQQYVVDSFIDVAPKVPTRVLLQVLGNLKTRREKNPSKLIFPKGSMSKALMIQTSIPALNEDIINSIKMGIENTLIDRFCDQERLGKVWIDPWLQKCPVPTAMRSVSKGHHTVARGTRLPIDDNFNTLRFFIHWVGEDIDLSASLHDENFKQVETIAFYNLRSKKYQAWHSGDIVSAPKPDGATEMIDITMDEAVKHGLRYAMMTVNVFRGPEFANHGEVYAGWMTREFPQSNQPFDPKTVQGKIDLTANTRFCMPVLFDMKEREAIWIDISSHTRTGRRMAGTAKSNAATIEQIIEGMVTSRTRVNLYELFELHASGRGTLVEDKDDADTIFSVYEGITPYHIMDINAEYIK
jgi:stress response protein SCP2